MRRPSLVVGLLVVATVAATPPLRNLAARQSAVPQLSPFQRQKAEQILSDRISCRGCHVIGGSGGRIGPDLTGAGGRLSRDEILARIADPQSLQPGSIMPRVPMPEPWRQLIADYLAESASDARPLEVGSAAQNAPVTSMGASLDGAALYRRRCASCHGDTGQGDGFNAPNLPVRPTAHANSTIMSLRSDDMLFDAIHGGGYIMNLHPFMPAFGETLSAEEIRALVRHIRTLCSCSGPNWSLDNAVAAAR